MKKVLTAVFLLLFLSTVGFSMGFSLKLKGGAAYVSGGGYNTAIQGINDYNLAYYDNPTGTFSKLNWGMDLGGELILNVNESFGIGLGAGYLSLSRDAEEFSGDWSLWIFDFTDTESIATSFSTIPVTLNLHYFLPLGGMNLDIYGGVGMYISKVKIRDIITSTFLGLGVDTDFEASKSAFGFQGGIGLDIPVSGNISFILDVTGRYVRLTDLQGEYTAAARVLGVWGTPVTGNNYYFWTYDYTSGGTAYPGFTLAETGPSGSSYSNVKHGTVDLSGVAAQAGLKISF